MTRPHVKRPGSLLRESRRDHFRRAFAVGAMAAVLAVAFRFLLERAEDFRDLLLEYFHHGSLYGYLIFIVLPGMAILAKYITIRVAPEAAGSGIPHVKGTLLHVSSLHPLRLIVTKILGGVLAIGAGLSLGREGSTVHLGAAAGKLTGELLGVPRRSERHLVACGAGAGLAAAFNAPLSGFLFVIEELQRELSPVTYGTAFIAAIVADTITRLSYGQVLDFQIRSYAAPSLTYLPAFIVLGVCCGVVGVLFSRLLLFGLRSASQIPKRFSLVLPGAVALLGVGIALWVPTLVGTGHDLAEGILTGRFSFPSTLTFLALLLVVKLLHTVLSYSCGVPGGIFAPILVLGALLGSIFGHVPLPADFTVLQPGAFAVIGMAGLFTAVVRAPLTGIVLVLEMTGNHEQLFALSTACLVSYLVAERLKQKPIYESLLEFDLQHSGIVSEDRGDPLLLESVVEPGSSADGATVRDLELFEGSLLVTVRRGGSELIPKGNTRLAAGDELIFLIAGDYARLRGAIDQLTRVPHSESDE